MPSIESKVITNEIQKMIEGKCAIIDVNTVNVLSDKPLIYKASAQTLYDEITKELEN